MTFWPARCSKPTNYNIKEEQVGGMPNGRRNNGNSSKVSPKWVRLHYETELVLAEERI